MGVDLSWAGRTLRALREAQGMSQSEPARRTGSPGTYLIALEQGRHEPSLDLLGRIATALGRDLRVVIWALAGEPYADPAAPSPPASGCAGSASAYARPNWPPRRHHPGHHLPDRGRDQRQPRPGPAGAIGRSPTMLSERAGPRTGPGARRIPAGRAGPASPPLARRRGRPCTPTQEGHR